MSDSKKISMGDDLNIQYSPQVKARMEADAEMAEFVRDFNAKLRQAFYGVQIGQYRSMDEALERLTGSRPQKIDPITGEEIEGSIDEDLGLKPRGE